MCLALCRFREVKLRSSVSMASAFIHKTNPELKAPITRFFVSSIQFNSYTQVYTPEYSQPLAGSSANLHLSVWDWDLRYSKEQISQFLNPGYDPEHCPDSRFSRQQVRYLHFNSLDSLRFPLLDENDRISESLRERHHYLLQLSLAASLQQDSCSRIADNVLLIFILVHVHILYVSLKSTQ